MDSQLGKVGQRKRREGKRRYTAFNISPNYALESDSRKIQRGSTKELHFIHQ